MDTLVFPELHTDRPRGGTSGRTAISSHQRYTPKGDAAVEARIHRDVESCAQAAIAALGPARVRAIWLAGGFGRGEGGLRRDLGRLVPYNDYDLFVVLHRDGWALRALARRRLGRLASELSVATGVEVEFGILQPRDLEGGPYNLMRCDLLHSGRVVCGDVAPSDLLSPMPAELIPVAEGRWLLVNRLALLALLRTGGVAPLERVKRYWRKVALACGDASLLAERRWHPSWVERQRRVRGRWGVELAEAYLQAVQDRWSGETTIAGSSDWARTLEWAEEVSVLLANSETSADIHGALRGRWGQYQGLFDSLPDLLSALRAPTADPGARDFLRSFVQRWRRVA